MRGKGLRLFLLLSLLAAAWGVYRYTTLPPPAVVAAARPNVLLISLDTLRPDHLGCYGYPRPTSPNLDRLAGQSVRFSNCRAQAPWTLQSHMSLFTSLLPSSNGVDSLNKVLPADIPTLTEILHGDGYLTAALVNDGQMKAHWGFSRGFDTWLEYPVDTRAGHCESIAAAAVSWLRDAPAPFFLFLHYYDTHDPYAAPEPFRSRLGTTLSGLETRRLCFGHRSPARPFADPALLPNIKAAYDAEIAWLDHELGKLLAAVPENTLIVVLSDHGEAFKEHGWMLHGATLYEEEIRVPLLVRLPQGQPQVAVVDESVMLLDVAPTILAQCGIRPPVHYQGSDLAALWQSEAARLQPRLVPAETRAVQEGRCCLAVVLYPLKAIYSLFDGRFELYKLPDERKQLGDADRAAAAALFKPLREWLETEQYWLIHATGQGDYEAVIELDKGTFGLFIPVGLDEMRDPFPELLNEGRALRWHVYPGGAPRPKALFLQPSEPSAALRMDCKINGERRQDMVFLGANDRQPDALPATVLADIAPVSPVCEGAFQATKPGFHVRRHQTAGSRPRPGQVAPLDEQTLRQLRSLGYLP